MKQETLEALQESIEHWEANVEAENWGNVDMSAVSCALCAMFALNRRHEIVCIGCPVQERVKRANCLSTPFHYAAMRLDHWRDSCDRWHVCDDGCEEEGCMEMRDEFRNAAREEVEFLKSLLPKE